MPNRSPRRGEIGAHAGRGDGPSAPELTDDWGNPVRPANLTKPYDATTKGDDASSIKRFVSELYYENKGLPPVVNGRRNMKP